MPQLAYFDVYCIRDIGRAELTILTKGYERIWCSANAACRSAEHLPQKRAHFCLCFFFIMQHWKCKGEGAHDVCIRLTETISPYSCNEEPTRLKKHNQTITASLYAWLSQAITDTQRVSGTGLSRVGGMSRKALKFITPLGGPCGKLL